MKNALAGCDAAGQPHYLNLSRDAEGNFEDWGVHLEYDDQSHGEYECISCCELKRETLRVDLTRTLRGTSEITGFDLRLKIDDGVFEQLRTALRRIFREKSAVLVEVS